MAIPITNHLHVTIYLSFTHSQSRHLLSASYIHSPLPTIEGKALGHIPQKRAYVENQYVKQINSENNLKITAVYFNTPIFTKKKTGPVRLYPLNIHFLNMPASKNYILSLRGRKERLMEILSSQLRRNKFNKQISNV